MTDFTSFDQFKVGNYLEHGTRASAQFDMEMRYPTIANFRTPPLKDGDTFNFVTALESRSELTPLIVGLNGDSPYLIKLSRGVLMDAAVVLNSENPQGLSYYPGKPPRGTYGSFVESLQTYTTRFTYINYERQALGLRCILLDLDPFNLAWGYAQISVLEYDSEDNASLVDRWFQLNDVTLYTHPRLDRIMIHAPIGWWDYNSTLDPPLPPSKDPLEFVIEGTMILDYGAAIGCDIPQTLYPPFKTVYDTVTGRILKQVLPAGPLPLIDTYVL